MSFLEFLGLERLLGNGDSDFEGGSILGGIFAFGLLFWVLLGIFKADFLKKGVVVFILLAIIILLIATLARFIQTRKDKKVINKVYYIVSIAVIIGAFLYGLKAPSHVLFYDYDYRGIYSGIGSIFWPLVIINVLFPFFCTEEKNFSDYVFEGIKMLFYTGIILVVMILISQVVSVIMYFTKNEAVYDKFIRYHNLKVTEKRVNWEYENVEDCIRKTLPTDAKNMMDKYKTTDERMKEFIEEGDSASIEKYTIEHWKQNEPEGEMTSNSISFSSAVWEDDYTVVYKLRDGEYHDSYYVRFNWKDYSIMDFIDIKDYIIEQLNNKVEKYVAEAQEDKRTTVFTMEALQSYLDSDYVIVASGNTEFTSAPNIIKYKEKNIPNYEGNSYKNNWKLITRTEVNYFVVLDKSTMKYYNIKITYEAININNEQCEYPVLSDAKEIE